MLDEDPASTHLGARYRTGTRKAVEVGSAAVEQRGSGEAVEGGHSVFHNDLDAQDRVVKPV